MFLGPSLAEVAALSTYRPGLALLVALGSPAINVGRVFRHVDVLEPFTRPVSRISRIWSIWLARQSTALRFALQIFNYIVALAAIADNIQNPVYTDFRTISGWRCGAVLMPLVWSLLAIGVHAWGMIAIRARLRHGYRPSISSTFRSTTFRKVATSDDCVLSEFMFWLASSSAIVHMKFGVEELSSLFFISVSGAIQVFSLYALSALLCQTVLLLELANLRYDLGEK